MQIDGVRIEGGELVLTTKDPAARRFAYNFKAGEYEIKKTYKKRSLNANALCWKLCTEIANVLRTDKDSIYIDMLKKYGQSDLITMLSVINAKHYFKYYDVFGTGYAKGKEYTHYKVYKGSSEYTTQEMAIFIDGIIDEAKALDIEVISEREKSLLLEAWENGEISTN